MLRRRRAKAPVELKERFGERRLHGHKAQKAIELASPGRHEGPVEYAHERALAEHEAKH